ncbi:hypothetical protein BDR26DRAFT_892362 [Obelidium mucronatum]|nr:hypothetical protein BDR26DRAFT_892362 [Obelidium mucronatum]
MILASILSLTATTLAQSAYCPPNPNSCQIQSDPYISTFQGPVVEFSKAGTFYALNSDEMTVQVVVGSHYVPRLAKNVYIVDQVTFSCKDGQQKTFTTANTTVTNKLVCNTGSCKIQDGCSLTVLPGLDPIPNVNVQEVRYMGSKAIGGLCFGSQNGCSIDDDDVDRVVDPVKTSIKTSSQVAGQVATPAKTASTAVAPVVATTTTCSSSSSTGNNASIVTASSSSSIAAATALTSTCTSNAVPPATKPYTAPTGLFLPTVTAVAPVTAFTTNLMYGAADRVVFGGVVAAGFVLLM